MEDQPIDPGGLTPDASPRPRRAHRMPVGKLRRGTVGEAETPEVETPEVETSSTEPTSAEGDTPAVASSASASSVAASSASASSVVTSSASVSAPAEPDEAAGTAEDDSDTESAETTDDSTTDETVVDPEILTPTAYEVRKPVGKWLKVAVIATAAMFVAAAGFAGATVQPYLADRALAAVKQDVAGTAASAIATLWTYTPEDMDALPDRASQFLSGDFEDAYRQYVDGIAATNKQAQVSNDTQVLGAAVESIGPSEATTIVYTNSTATSPLTKGIPSLRYVSYRLTMERHGAKWLVTKMSTITSLDLTPQL